MIADVALLAVAAVVFAFALGVMYARGWARALERAGCAPAGSAYGTRNTVAFAVAAAATVGCTIALAVVL